MSPIDFFYNAYCKIEDKNSFLEKIKYYAAQRFFITLLLKIYFRLTCNNPDYSLRQCDKKSGRVIVSFTSFPARIHTLWIVVETILRQTSKPDKLILWISKKEFPTLDSLPKKLLNQRKRGLEIMLVDENIRSHKKYYYVMKEYPEDYIITIDDDLIYNGTLIQKLVEAERKNPGCVCSFARELPTYKNGELDSYYRWPKTYKDPIGKDLFTAGPGEKYFFLTGIGTIYPPHSLYEDITNIKLALKICPLADDIWLNTMARLKKTKTVYVPGYEKWVYICNSNKVGLYTVNNWLSLNDTQIEFVRMYYTGKLGIDPYKEN